MKISVVGFSGSGKSSFAYKLSQLYQIDVTYIDKLQFLTNWEERDSSIRNMLLDEAIEKDSFIIDGNYQSIGIKRFERSDHIFIFNFNRWKCLYGAVLRRIKYHGKTRRSMTEGNKEKLDFEFIWWILFKSRTRKRKKFYKDLKIMYPTQTIEFKNRKQVNRYLLQLGIHDFKEKS